uniref:Bax inhibitor 1 n=1 Tax=Globodera rostochiensis TaxID=31243 RepID=A0A914HTN7_GLORO
MATKHSSSSHRMDEPASDFFGNIQRIFTSLPNKLEFGVREHLKKVYGTLTLALLSATFGIVVNAVMDFSRLSIIFSLAVFGLMIAITLTESTVQNENKRLAYLYVLTFLMGCQTGPLVEYVGLDDPTIVFNALLITMLVFGSFTMAALYAESTKYLYLGGILSSALLCLLVTVLFAPYTALFRSFILWGGLAINVGFVLYDTQLIAEKRRRGDNDYIWHTVMLFVDFVNIFRYVLIILKEKSDKDKRRR